ncbi:hypothetical protein [Sphingobacterium siyangense]|uniref:hypothetical protein n=1 Tax=Sphingobacterium siyangense TaxID=459529 RepID=UPI003DA4C8C8
MKNKLANLSALLLLSPMGLLAQDNKHMTLEEIIHLAANQSVEAKSTDTKILEDSSKLKLPNRNSFLMQN